MKIFVLPRKQFIDMDDCCIDKIMNKYNVISINTPEYKERNIIKEEPPFDKKYFNYPNVLILYFHDWYKPNYKDVVYFDDNMAKKIFDFMENRKFENTVIHCTAGVSRSAAVGYVLNQYYNINNKSDYNDFESRYASIHIPNSLVVQTLSNAFKIENKYIQKQKHEKVDVEKLAKQVGLI